MASPSLALFAQRGSPAGLACDDYVAPERVGETLTNTFELGPRGRGDDLALVLVPSVVGDDLG